MSSTVNYGKLIPVGSLVEVGDDDGSMRLGTVTRREVTEYLSGEEPEITYEVEMQRKRGRWISSDPDIIELITPPKSLPFTVILLYPDYIASVYGKETCMWQTYGATPEQAIIKAQRDQRKNADHTSRADDWFCIACLPGHIDDLKP